MKVDFSEQGAALFDTCTSHRFTVSCESDRLTDVLLCSPQFLEAVPCCSKTEESLRGGFQVNIAAAEQQHAALIETLRNLGVECHILPSRPGLPDLCFTRDMAVTTPWGPVVLNPAKAHRRAEADFMSDQINRLVAQPPKRIVRGSIEGGDICLARPGLLFVGVSGERTDDVGASNFAAPFLADGWEVITCPLDPHFLHLDTVFCMLDRTRALACVDVLDDDFLDKVTARGIAIVPVRYKESRNLGGNILSVDGHTILTNSATPRISGVLRQGGFRVIELEISQFSACGGGLHCLTMPLRREAPQHR